MGRLHHLMQTLPANIANTASYPDREFVVVNYGSKDALHEWMRDHMKPWIDQGVVKYYRTQEPEYFVATHAKNIAHRQATGDILCNVDADNFLQEGFCEYLVGVMKPQTIVVSPSADSFGNPGCCGKIATWREHFYAVNGYDEDWNIGWGWDDTNFQFRARMHSNLVMHECEPKWNLVIPHSNEERSKNFRDKDAVKTGMLSAERLQEVANRKEYIANQGKMWGVAADLSSDL